MCNQDILNIITTKVVQAATKSLGSKLDRVILYGSYARGDFGDESDIDIVVLADIAIDARSHERERIRNLLNYIELEYDVVLSLKIIDCTTFNKFIHIEPFYQNVEREGVVLNA